MKKFFTKQNLIFIALFTILGFLALQVPFTQLLGSKARFTLFDFFGPIATGFIGTLPGIISVFLMQFLNFLLHGARVVDAGTIIRFFPMLFGAWYFGKKSRLHLVIPALAIIAFTVHPIGRTSAVYSLFWLIPILCHFFRDRFLLARALGATFTAHAVGGALWVWTFGLTREMWLSLIPITALERSLFALGIAASYIILNNVLDFFITRKLITIQCAINRKYVLLLNRHVQ